MVEFLVLMVITTLDFYITKILEKHFYQENVFSRDLCLIEQKTSVRWQFVTWQFVTTGKLHQSQKESAVETSHFAKMVRNKHNFAILFSKIFTILKFSRIVLPICITPFIRVERWNWSIFFEWGHILLDQFLFARKTSQKSFLV